MYPVLLAYMVLERWSLIQFTFVLDVFSPRGMPLENEFLKNEAISDYWPVVHFLWTTLINL